jgi:hypothetical protein
LAQNVEPLFSFFSQPVKKIEHFLKADINNGIFFVVARKVVTELERESISLQSLENINFFAEQKYKYGRRMRKPNDQKRDKY